MPNVKIVSYTPVEYLWAAAKGVQIGTFTIKPVGSQETSYRKGMQSLIPSEIDKNKTLFIPDYLAGNQKTYVLDQCKLHKIPVYCGRYNGPYDLKDFKGIIYIPYQWSNLALFENIYNGLIHFVPSEKFVQKPLARISAYVIVLSIRLISKNRSGTEKRMRISLFILTLGMIWPIKSTVLIMKCYVSA